MPWHSSNAAQRQVHTILPGPNGQHACLTLYDVCPHSKHAVYDRSVKPYLHCELPSASSQNYAKVVEYEDKEGREIVETTRSTLSYPRALTASPAAPLVLSKDSLPLIQHPIRSILKQPQTSSLALHRHPAPPAPPSEPIPTIYILTFSTDLTPTTRSFASLLNTHLPTKHPPIPLLYTIDARSFLVPPLHICAYYSGVAEPVQDAVLRDPRARQEIQNAVSDLLEFAKRGRGEVSMSACCTAGTHRSVAIAELIALGVRKEVRRMGSKEGLKVVVRHVHRVRGVKDPY